MAQARTVQASRSAGEDRERIFDAFRRWGYLEANLDPLGFLKPQPHPELVITGEAADQARKIYCGTIGADFMHLQDPARRRWIAQGLEAAGAKGAAECVLAMSHRGRLNVMAHIVCRPFHEVFAGFEDVDPRSVLGAGDVKYHVGATGEYQTAGGASIRIHLVSNPSHLEAVDPVAIGRARAKQTRQGADGRRKVLPVVLHGDAAFAGQGIWAETLNFADIAAYTVGGTIHIIVNNLIGFTTRPPELHSSRFAADLAKRQSVPIFHVNGEDPAAVVRVGRLAAEYRYAFSSDVVVDMIGYRRHGHSEVDDPTITRPLLYKKIKDHPQLWQIYAKETAAEPPKTVEQIRAEYEAGQKIAKTLKKIPSLRELPDYWSPYKRGCYDSAYEVDTGVPLEKLAEVSDALTRTPGGFHVHPKVQKLLEQRAEMGHGKRAVDFGFAEPLALGTLLLEGTPVRLSGQDTVRGTFNQRHAALVDTETEEEYLPLQHLAPKQAWCEIHNSTLSEAGCLGFEYGFSRDFPEALVLWEAQFGDFANGAQVIIDQFISAGEDKWDLPSGVVLLLPHGFEGQGPEHSSARIERFLQLAAEDNIQVCQP